MQLFTLYCTPYTCAIIAGAHLYNDSRHVSRVFATPLAFEKHACFCKLGVLDISPHWTLGSTEHSERLEARHERAQLRVVRDSEGGVVLMAWSMSRPAPRGGCEGCRCPCAYTCASSELGLCLATLGPWGPSRSESPERKGRPWRQQQPRGSAQHSACCCLQLSKMKHVHLAFRTNGFNKGSESG